MKQKKLLIIGPHYDTFIKGSGEELSKYYNQVFVIIPIWKKLNFFEKKFTIFNSVNKTYSSNKKNVKIYYVPISFILPLAIKELSNFIKVKNLYFNLILSHFLVPYGYVGNRVAKKFNVKSVIIGHGFDVYDLPFRNFFYKKIIKGILKKANKIITVSRSNLDCIKQLGFQNKTIVIPNGFDSNKFKKLNKFKCRKKLGLSSNKKIILTVGNLVKVKNHKNLILAINELIKIRKDFICYIIGGGILREKLEQLISNMNLSKYVKLRGQKLHDEIPLWMNAADVFVLPSYNEGNPTVMFEALGCGTPYVGTNVGGVGEIINSEDFGLLYDNPKDYKKLAALLGDALNKTWNENIILDYSNKFTWITIIKKINNVC